MREALVLLAMLACALDAVAHPLAPSLMEIEEGVGGAVHVRWKTPSRRVPGSRLAPSFPEDCRVVSERAAPGTPLEVVTEIELACDGDTLVGRRFGVTDLAASKADVLVRVQLRDGHRVLRVLRPGDESLVVPARPSARIVLANYARLGVSHILTGFDHLCFVLGLMLLVGGGRRLLWTVTAFTVGHSVTLSLAALGVVHFPPRPIEVLIALSIYVLALEIVRPVPERGGLGRRPWAMAAAFGLLHGLGFAGALAAVGLPSADIPLALVSFNLGIEAGQIAFVLAVLAVARLARPLAGGTGRLAWVPPYAIGSLAAYWMLDRLLFGG